MKNSDKDSGHDGSENNASNDFDASCCRLVDNIRAMVETLGPSLSSNCCIYRVPKKLHELKEAAYTPHLVSIGPFHNGKEGLQNVEEHKVRYLDKILRLQGVSLKKLVIYIKECEERVRSCYAETIVLKDDDFLKMVLLDGCFIIKLFLMSYYRDFEDEDDRILRKSLFTFGIRVDLLLLKNQLPFFLLEGLYNIVNSTLPYSLVSFLELSCHFYSYYNQQEKTFHLPSPEMERRPPKDNTKFQLSKSATRLQEAGVKFKVGHSKCLFDIQYTDGSSLEIPFLKFVDTTESYLRNIMALEQCHYSEIVSFSSYIHIMDSLIDTAKDVELLVEAGIIENWLGDSNQVASLVNSLSKQIPLNTSTFYYTRLCQDLNEYCEVPWNSWKATCRHEYFSTPWKIVSTIAAFVLLLLTFIQTVASIISFICINLLLITSLIVGICDKLL